MQVRYFRKRFQTNAAGLRVNTSFTAKDPYWNAVGLLLRGRTGAANGGQNNTVLDSSANNFTITRTGNATQSSFSPYGSTGGSLYFDGTGDYVNAPDNVAFAFGTGDFTMEGWFYLTNTGAVIKGIQSCIDSNLDTWAGVHISVTAANLLRVDCYNTANQPIWNGNHQTTVTPNTWHHFAMVRTSGNGRMFLDGVLGTYVPTLLDTLGQSGVTVGSSYPGTNPWFGYLSDIRVVKGSALYTANFVPPTAPLTAVANTQLLLSGTNASLPDVSGRTSVETVGNAQSSTTVKKFGSTSMYFDGSGDKLELKANPDQWSMGGQDFTIDFWVYPTSIAGTYCILSSSSYTGFEIQSNPGGNWIFNSSSNGSSWDIANGIVIGAVTLNTWQHLAVCRSGGKIRLFKDGVLNNTVSSTASLFANGTGLALWSRVGNTPNAVPGYMDEVRITKGVARYTSDFAVDVQVSVDPYAQNSTSILTSGVNNATNNTILDGSANNLTITRNGNVAQGTFSPFSPVAPATYNPALNGGSMYFDGSGDSLPVPNSSSFDFGTTDFTIESWAYFTDPVVTAGSMGFISATAGGLVFDIKVNRSNMYPTARVKHSSGASLISIQSSFPVNRSEWVHYALTRTSGTVYFWINGVLAGSAAIGSAAVDYFVSSPIIVGSGGGSADWTGYVSDVRVVKGTALYTAAFTPPTAPLTAVANTQLLLNGTNAAVYDSRGKVNLELLGTCKVSTAVKKYSASLAFDGTSGCYATLSGSPQQCALGTGDFTIEMWVYRNTVGTQQFLFDARPIGLNGVYPDLYISAGNLLAYYVSSADRIASTTTLSAGVWYHVALSRVNGITKLFLNGIQEGSSYTDANNYILGAARPVLGMDGTVLNNALFNGYIEDFRITKGIGRYATGFTVPSTTLGAVVKTLPTMSGGAYDPATVEPTGGDPYYNRVVLHMHMEGTNGSTNFADQKGKTITVGGNTHIRTDRSKFGPASAYFDGTGDYLSVPSSYVPPGSEDFTIEFWIYHTTTPGTNTHYWDARPAAQGAYGLIYRVSANGFLAYEVGTSAVITGSTVVSTNAWHHIALARSAGRTRLFLDGAQQGATWIDTTVYVAPSGVTLGINKYDNSSNPFAGYMDEVRVTSGVARYVSTFAIPTQAFPDYQDYQSDVYAKQSLTLKGLTSNGNFIDGSTNGFSITRTGNVKQGTFSPFSNAGFSVGFFGGGLSTPASSGNFNLVGGPTRTFEGWAYMQDINSLSIVYEQSTGGTGSFIIYFSGGNLVTGASNGTQATQAIPKDTWFHWAVTINGTAITPFVNGVKGTTATVTISVATTGLVIGGRPGVGYWLQGYLADLHISSAVLYSANFMVPTSKLTPVASTILLCCQDNRFKDNSTNNFALTVNGAPSIQALGPFTAQTYVPATHGGSLYFDGTTDVLYTAASGQPTLSGDFTVECWVYDSSANTSPTFICMGPSTVGVRLAVYQSQMDFYVGATELLTGTHIKNQWVHYAMTRSGTTVRCFQNGVQFATTTKSGAVGSATTRTFIGATDTSGGWGMTGHIADLRVVDGTCLYSANFVPPTAPLTAVANTQLLMSGTNAAIIDPMGRFNVETVGDAKVDAVNKVYSKSLAFDGTGDYLTLPANQLCLFRTADFTIECWFKATTISATQQFVLNSWVSPYPFGIDYASNAVRLSLNGTVIINAGATIVAGTWYHLAASRQAGQARLFLNGVQVGTTTANSTDVSSVQPICIGAKGDTFGNPVSGLVEDPRITLGVARYISNFTPPLAALPVS